MMPKRFQGEASYFHGKEESVGVLLVNLGTPDEADAKAVRRYLAEFLGDPRVVEIPRLVWLPILYGVILQKRPPKTAELYRSIWMEEGSPLLVFSQRQQAALSTRLKQRFAAPIHVEIAMRYGNPSIAHGLQALKEKGARRVLVLPLYPQYSATTTGTAFDAVAKVLQQWRWIPEMRFVNHYHDHPLYIEALARSVEEHWNANGRARFLLMSFHGLPQRNLHQGDPYHCECHKTARLLAEHLGLEQQQWGLSFQSRFGKQQWLQPYTDKTLEKLPAKGVTGVDVICPGFAADCLETLEEIEAENRAVFLEAGGEDYYYIAALNDMPAHIDLLTALVETHMQGWPEVASDWHPAEAERAQALAQKLAKQQGAKL